MRVQTNVHAELGPASVDRPRNIFSASFRHRVGAARLEEALQDIKHVRRHGALRREAAEDAHGVDEIPEERFRHELVDGLV